MRNGVFTKRFWIESTERAVKTAAQTVLTAFALSEGFNAFAMDWPLAGGFALGGAVFSYLTSVASAPSSGGDGPSLV